MTTENFAHGVARADVVGGMVRLELFTLRPSGEGEPPVAVPTQAVLMPMEGFLQAFAVQEGLIQKLVQAGVLSRRDQAAEPAQPGSPNFV